MSAAGAILRGAGRRKGWRSLAPGSYVTYKTAAAGPAEKDLTVGRVIRNEQVEQRILVQPSRGVWVGTRIVHRLEYLTVEGAITTEALDNRRREETVKYAALVSQVELLTGGELMHGCSRRLEKGGWGLKIEVEEQVRFYRQLGPLADLHGVLDPSVCRVPRPDWPLRRVPRQGETPQQTVAVAVEVTPVEYGWRLADPGGQGAAGILQGVDQVRAVFQEGQHRERNKWMERLAAEDMSGPDFPVAQYLQLRDVLVEGNASQTPTHLDRCLLAVGLGPGRWAARDVHGRGDSPSQNGRGCTLRPPSQATGQTCSGSAFASRSKAIRLAISAGIRCNGIMFGPSDGAVSGS